MGLVVPLKGAYVCILGRLDFDKVGRKEQDLIAGRTVQEYQENGQLAEEECAQEVNEIYRLV